MFSTAQSSTITPSGVPPQAPGDRSYANKLGKDVGGIAEVPRYKVIESGRDAFDQLKSEMLSSRAIAGTIIFALASWAVAQLTGPVGWVLDGILLGIAVTALGLSAFGLFERCAALLLKIDRARTDQELADCSIELVNLMVEIGMATFVALVTRAAARRLLGGGDGIESRNETDNGLVLRASGRSQSGNAREFSSTTRQSSKDLLQPNGRLIGTVEK